MIKYEYMLTIPINYQPREYQVPAMRALEGGAKLVVLCWARRAGKDKTGWAYAVRAMVAEPMNVVLVFPIKKQGREAFWNNIENSGAKTIDAIPPELIESKRDDEMFISLKNGSTFQILGAKDPDALRGANGKLYIFSEFVDIPASALNVIRPITRNNGGQIIIQSTPKIDGISGGTFKTIFDRTKKKYEQGDKNYFASLVTADNYMDEVELEEARQEAINENGNDFFFRQEYLCDFGQASATSYYGHALQAMKEDGRIGLFPYNKNYPVYTAWDLGIADSTAVVFFQYYKNTGTRISTPHIIDYYESNDLGNQHHVSFILSKPYIYGWHFLPHDGNVRDSDAIERIEKIRQYGLQNTSLLQKELKQDGIDRVATELPKSRIHRPLTQQLVDKLLKYKRKFNPLTGDYLGPEHKTESHAADAVRYMYAAIEKEFDKETCELLFSQVGDSDEYESDLVATTFYQP